MHAIGSMIQLLQGDLHARARLVAIEKAPAVKARYTLVVVTNVNALRVLDFSLRSFHREVCFVLLGL